MSDISKLIRLGMTKKEEEDKGRGFAEPFFISKHNLVNFKILDTGIMVFSISLLKT
jgi:hypothetical protein